MPTGYTAGIIDGKIKTFKQFATQCIRNFGAAIHMRDEPWGKPYKPREPSAYYTDEIKDAQERLTAFEKMSDGAIMAERKAEIEKDKKYHHDKITEAQKTEARLNKFLDEARKYTPPTDQHTGIKTFMVQQITETIKFDCRTEYHNEAIQRLNEELETMTAKTVRKDKRDDALKDLKYAREHYELELKACNESNEWAQKFFDSLK